MFINKNSLIFYTGRFKYNTTHKHTQEFLMWGSIFFVIYIGMSIIL